MNKTNSALKSAIPSLVVLAAGLVAVLAGIAPKFQSSAADMINFSQLYVSAAITVFIAFCFGAVRYSLAIGFGLALISLHDLLLTLALTALVSLALPQAAIMPVLVMFAPVFTFALSLPVIRAARDLRAANSARDMSDEQVAEEAVKSTRSLRMGSALLALLFIAAGAAGGLKLTATLMPLLAGLAAALLSSCVLTGKVWLLAGARFGKNRKK